MKRYVLPILLILLVMTAGFFAIYLREAPKIPKNQAHLPGQAHLPAPLGPIRIGIIGESQGDGVDGKPFNREVLIQLFEVLKKRDVQAIFFTGNLTLGWVKSDDANSETAEQKAPASDENMFKDYWESKGYVYNGPAFRQQLHQFHTLFREYFPDQVRLYPMMGNHEAIGPDAAKIFRKEFDLKDSSPLGESMVAYTVSIQDTLFVIIPTDYFDIANGRGIEHSVTPEMLQWLDKVLHKAALTHRYIFVLGHKPAFSTPQVFEKPHNLDTNPDHRDSLWQVLRDNGVLAYFASHEHLYDRSNRKGIWQIISGGGGSPLKGGESNAFYHCLLLTIPPPGHGLPKVEVLDVDGKVKDEFELSQKEQTLFQMRIS